MGVMVQNKVTLFYGPRCIYGRESAGGGGVNLGDCIHWLGKYMFPWVSIPITTLCHRRSYVLSIKQLCPNSTISICCGRQVVQQADT